MSLRFFFNPTNPAAVINADIDSIMISLSLPAFGNLLADLLLGVSAFSLPSTCSVVSGVLDVLFGFVGVSPA